MEALRTTTAAVLATEIPGGIRYDQQLADITVLVCGNECVDRTEVTAELRADDVPVRQMGCLALCKRYEPLESGSYALVPSLTESPPTPVIIRK